ncbi:Uncharacterised protein [Bordetella pertussis]|nr:Uncharacterised protein [Bordetella pertussis]
MAVVSDSGIQISAVMKQVPTVPSIRPRTTSRPRRGVADRRGRPWRSSMNAAMVATAV